ncbi:aspartate 1-decarboxylase [Alkalicoccus chagannorensis]|uniref:aspartate 1-decarboxylase n=1 Tax=Alkalicoccus chagannorensis TaxID=427072 RepID=UPI000427E0FC|nr:aspartate 1-decarboxylase [Alkalicoccus chagannorensis]
MREMMSGKLHRAVVTEANLQYVGSITIDPELLEEVDMLENEKVQVVNNNNGARLETYIIPGVRGSRTICLNGAAARHVQPGDHVIIIAYQWMDHAQALEHVPKVAVLDEENNVVQRIGTEPASTIL